MGVAHRALMRVAISRPENFLAVDVEAGVSAPTTG
jgi:hypothetical protein